MKPVQIPFPVTSAHQSPARAGIGRMVNVILEQLPDETINRKRAPGLASFATSASGSVHCRGMILANAATVLVVYNNFVEALDSAGAATGLGSLDGSDLVTLAINNKSPTPDIVCVSPSVGAFVLQTAAAPASYPDLDVGSPNSVCFGGGYFFFTYGNGGCVASGVNDTAINLLDRIVVSSPGLVRGIFFGQTLFLFTTATIEAWVDTANPTGFPYSRAAIIPRGLINANAVAGHESGFAGSLIWVGSDNIVYIMQGYAPRRISTADIETRIAKVADKASFRATAYMSSGHAIWQLTCSDFTLCYDITNSVWTERDSRGQPFSRIEGSVSAFGGWLVGDLATGLIGSVSAEAYDEYGDFLTYSITSLPATKFPEKTVVRRADFNFIAGTGVAPLVDPPEGSPANNPKVLVSWSDDGGASFKMPLQRELGQVGQTNQAVVILRTGRTTRFGRVWRLEVSDPVYIGLLGGSMERTGA